MSETPIAPTESLESPQSMANTLKVWAAEKTAISAGAWSGIFLALATTYHASQSGSDAGTAWVVSMVLPAILAQPAVDNFFGAAKLVKGIRDLIKNGNNASTYKKLAEELGKPNTLARNIKGDALKSFER